ncbi:MAG: hypothetical protein QHH06_10490 [Clostridiales bacterium]|jgi:hypothetical protein|nr:hypothetical protein [Clostridiales bacterium]
MIAIMRSSLNLKTKEITRKIVQYRDDEIDYTPLIPILFEVMKDYFEKHPEEIVK